VQVEGLLHKVFPRHWTPLYTMVAFTRTRYSEALAKSQRQEWWMSALTTAGVVGVGAAVAALGLKVALAVSLS
jgi:kynurenine 3-monooxygenase